MINIVDKALNAYKEQLLLWQNQNFLFVDEADSTNNIVKRSLIEGCEHGFIVVAQKQIKGKGRMGRSFFSVQDGLFMTVAVRSTSDFMLLTSAAAAAVHESILNVCGFDCGIKWVNDLYLDNKKICGILAEGVLGRNGVMCGAAVGIGINFYQDIFPLELQEVASALYRNEYDYSLNTHKKAQLVQEIYNKLLYYTAHIEKREFVPLLKQKSVLLNKRVKVINPTHTYMATAKDISCNGGLVLDRDGEIIELTTGEVSIRF